MYLLVTNNSLCWERYGRFRVDYIEGGSYMDVLVRVRDYIQKGYRLETHPMAGSLKPNQIPYKSVIVSDGAVDPEEFCEFELIIENNISLCRDFLKSRPVPDWPEELKRDFREVDLSLIESAASRIGWQAADPAACCLKGGGNLRVTDDNDC